MTRVQVAGTVVGCALCFGLGTLFSGTNTPQAGTTETTAHADAEATWRAALQAARTTADAGSLRSHALEVLNTADGDLALADAVELLGWVAADEDLELLLSFALSGEPALSRPGLNALGRLGSPAAITDLRTLLDRRDIDRYGVLLALGATGDPSVLPLLEDRLNDPEMGHAASAALARYGGPSAAQSLARALRTADLNHSAHIARALGSLADDVPEASESLRYVLSGPRTTRRQAALGALAQAGDPVVFDLLLEDLNRGNAAHAAHAAHALGELGDRRAVPALTWAARDGQSEVRYSAMNALAALDLPSADRALLDLVEEASAQVAARAVHALPRVSDDKTLAVLLWAAQNRPTEVKQAVHSRLFSAPWGREGVPEDVLTVAREELSAASWGSWGTDPVGLLLMYGEPSDLVLVEDALRDGNNQARSSAVWSLQQLQTPAADQLLHALADDVEPGVRQAALTALLDRGQDDMVETKLLTLLDSGTLDYGSTEQLLVRIGTPRAVQAVLDRIEHGTQREWSAAIGAIAQSGSKEQVDRLLAIADRTDNAQLKSQILQSVVYSETADLEAVVDRALAADDPMLEATATQALARMGTPESLQTLLELSQADTSETRQSALSALAQVGGDQAEEAMVEALDDPDVSWAAISGLQQLGTRSARDALVNAAQTAEDPSVRAAVLHQLPWMHGIESDALLVSALSDDADEVRTTAISALESLGTTQAAESLAELLSDSNASDSDIAMAAQALQRMGGAVAERHADAIEELVPDDPFTVDTGLGHIDF